MCRGFDVRLSDFILGANSNSGSRVLMVGGNWNNDLNCGLWYANWNYNSSNTNTNIGGRLHLYQKNIKNLHIIFLAVWQKLIALD